jgi:RecB family exonuclease
LTAWSYSRLTTWEECPLKCKLKNIDKIQEPDGPAKGRGIAIEGEVMDYIFGRAKTLPESCARFPEELAALRKISNRLVIKKKLAFTREWKLCDYFGSDAWLRIEMDLFWEELIPGQKKHWRVRVVDIKTGKIYEDKVDQVELYNLCALLLDEPDDFVTHSPQTAFSELYYLDQGETRDRAMVASDVAKAKSYWENRAVRMLADTAFQPTPSYRCKWCFFRKANKAEGGGQCPY